MPATLKILRSTFICAAALTLSACVGPNPLLAPSIAQPDTRPARNFTSFSASLECMDSLLVQARRGTKLISSTDIPDETKNINVGGDDMLINAISQMNRRSQSYVFLDQALVKFGGLKEIRVQNGDEVMPQLYIRGSISQLDKDVTDDNISVTTTNSTGNLTGSNFGPHRKLSVVSVDMHLVQYPSRRVIPGASVANSMVVIGQGFGTGASGLINMTTLGISIKINRIESQSQAVRNLIELGVIELLGRHAGVPYWNCLGQPHTDAKQNGRNERRFTRTPDPINLPGVQNQLAQLGYLASPFEAKIGPKTRAAIARFQADQRIVPNGILDYDLTVLLDRRMQYPLTRLPQRTVPKSASVRTAAAVRKSPPKQAAKQAPKKPIKAEKRGLSCPTSSPGKPCDDSYINLFEFLNKE